MAFPIPSMMLKQLYTFGSLKNTPDGVKFSLKNRLSDATMTLSYSRSNSTTWLCRAAPSRSCSTTARC